MFLLEYDCNYPNLKEFLEEFIGGFKNRGEAVWQDDTKADILRSNSSTPGVLGP